MSVGNSFIEKELFTEEVTDPTLGNGNGTYIVSFGDVRVFNSTDDIVGAEFSGDAKVSVNSVNGNTVTLLFEEPDGGGNFQDVADGTISGDLEVNAQG
jgi:hypothetical protein